MRHRASAPIIRVNVKRGTFPHGRRAMCCEEVVVEDDFVNIIYNQGTPIVIHDQCLCEIEPVDAEMYWTRLEQLAIEHSEVELKEIREKMLAQGTAFPVDTL